MAIEPRGGSRADRPVRGRPNKQHAEGRVCTDPGCSTVLSKYNAGTRCWLHDDSMYTPSGYRIGAKRS